MDEWCPFIFRIVRSADRAIAADHGNADRGSVPRKVISFSPIASRGGLLDTPDRHPFPDASVLKIKNLALVDDLTWELGSGLIGVTGQTGAGKSMIVGALKLILGERANHDLIRTGESLCSVEAIFELTPISIRSTRSSRNSGLEPCEGNSLVVKRSFGSGQQAVRELLALHPLGPEIARRLPRRPARTARASVAPPQDRQLAMLDAYAHAGPERNAYRDAYATLAAARGALEDFRSQRQVSDQEIELPRFQVEEIAAAFA